MVVQKLMRWLGYELVDLAAECPRADKRHIDTVSIPEVEKILVAEPAKSTRVEVFKISETQVEAHTSWCREAVGRAVNCGETLFTTTREALEHEGTTVYDHACMRP